MKPKGQEWEGHLTLYPAIDFIHAYYAYNALLVNEGIDRVNS